MTTREAAREAEFCVIFGTNEGGSLPLGEGTLSLGRAVENDIILDGAAIADRHATIELADAYIVVESTHPVWTDSIPARGTVEIGFDVPFRIGSCLCVVTRDSRSWFERDNSDFIARIFGQAAAGASTDVDEADATGESQEESAPEAGAVFDVPAGSEVGAVDPSLRTSAEDRVVSSWRQVLDAWRSWCVYDRRRLRRAIIAALALALIALPIVGEAAIDRAHAWVLTGMQGMATQPDSVPGKIASQAPVVEDRQQEELKAVVSLVKADGQVKIVRSPDGAFAVRGFVMSGNAHVRLLSGLSMLPFPVEMQVQNRGGQIKALELLVSHAKDANLKTAVDGETGRIRLSGSLPTQAQVDEFVQQVKLELPSVEDLSLEVESTDTVAKQIAERVRKLDLSQIQVMRSATEIVVTGTASDSEMESLEAALADIVTTVPVQNRVTLYQGHDSLRLTAGDLGLMAIVMGTRPVVVDHSGHRFRVGDVLKGGFRIVDISFDEVLVQQGTLLATVALDR